MARQASFSSDNSGEDASISLDFREVDDVDVKIHHSYEFEHNRIGREKILGNTFSNNCDIFKLVNLGV